MRKALLLVLLAAPAFAGDTFTGWVSDEGCARSRLTQKEITGNNPDCVKRCVGEGKAVVLIADKERAIFKLADATLLKPELGNYVSVTGLLDKATNTLAVQSVKLLEVGVAKCARKPLKE